MIPLCHHSTGGLHRDTHPSLALVECYVCVTTWKGSVSVVSVGTKGWTGEKVFKQISLISLSFLQCDDKCQLLLLFYTQLLNEISTLGRDPSQLRALQR